MISNHSLKSYRRSDQCDIDALLPTISIATRQSIGQLDYRPISRFQWHFDLVCVLYDCQPPRSLSFSLALSSSRSCLPRVGCIQLFLGFLPVVALSFDNYCLTPHCSHSPRSMWPASGQSGDFRICSPLHVLSTCARALPSSLTVNRGGEASFIAKNGATFLLHKGTRPKPPGEPSKAAESGLKVATPGRRISGSSSHVLATSARSLARSRPGYPSCSWPSCACPRPVA